MCLCPFSKGRLAHALMRPPPLIAASGWRDARYPSAMAPRKDPLSLALHVAIYVVLYFVTAAIFGRPLLWLLDYLAGITVAGLLFAIFANWLALRIYENRPAEIGLWWNRASGAVRAGSSLPATSGCRTAAAERLPRTRRTPTRAPRGTLVVSHADTRTVAGHAAHAKHVDLLLIASEVGVGLIPVHLRLLAEPTALSYIDVLRRHCMACFFHATYR